MSGNRRNLLLNRNCHFGFCGGIVLTPGTLKAEDAEGSFQHEEASGQSASAFL